MAPYLKAVLNYKEDNREPDPNSFQHINKINPVEHDPHKLQEVRKVRWDQTVMSHSLSC